jgi:hypothetical protein
MLTHPTIDQLRTLKLDGMADAFIELQAQDKARDLAHAEWLALLLDGEAASRSTRRFQTRLRAARLRHSQASIENVDYRVARRLDKALFQQIATCRWIAEHRNLLVTGCTSPYVIDNQSFVAADLLILHDHSATRGELLVDRDRFPGSRKAPRHNFAWPAGHCA